MKKLITLLLIMLPLGVSAQNPFQGFFDKKNGTTVTLRADGDKSSSWFIRPTAQLTAISFSYDKELKVFESSPFSAAGIGLGYQHYVEHNGVLINNYGFNTLIILNAENPDRAGFSLAGTINAMQFVNAGGGYDFTNKRWLILLGSSWSF